MSQVELVERGIINTFIYILISYIQFLRDKGYKLELHY